MRSLATVTVGAMIKRALIFSLACAALLLGMPLCHAQEGGFDPTFGNGGRLLVDVSVLGHSDVLQRLIVLPSGKLLMTGTCDYQDPVDPNLFANTFCVTQLLSNGTYDGTFGPGGLGYIQFNRFSGWPKNAGVTDAIVLRDGRIALLGHTFGDGGAVDPSFLLAVLRADGTALDATVGGGSGYVQSQFAGKPGAGISLAQQPDGKLLVAGAATGVNGNDDFAVARFLADLSGLDSTFGSGGAQTVAFDLGGPGGDNSDRCAAVRLQSDGKIVMVGLSITSPAGQPASGAAISITRLNTDGTRDLTFGTTGDGRLHYTAGQNLAGAQEAQIDASDRIVVGGAGAAATGATTALWIIDRLSKDGGRDATFNQGNPQALSIAPGYGGAVDRLALTNDGIFAIGETPRVSAGTTNYAAIVRLKADGSLDSKFGNGGKSYFSFTSTEDFNTSARAVAVSKSGLIVAGTQTQNVPEGYDVDKFAVGRLQYDQIFSYGFE